jgi:hypothetical protein
VYRLRQIKTVLVANEHGRNHCAQPYPDVSQSDGSTMRLWLTSGTSDSG